MDELIYGVAQYSIPERGEAQPVKTEPVAQAAKVEPPAVAAAPAKAAPVAAAAPASPIEEPDFTDFAGFNDDDFELALDDLDLIWICRKSPKRRLHPRRSPCVRSLPRRLPLLRRSR